MAKRTRKATEFNNVNETWRENEAQRAGNNLGEPEAVSGDLQKIIEEEAAEYDEADKEDRLLGGDRATVRDE